jgi:hypothetical protein
MFERYGGVTPTDGGDCYITQVRELAMTGFWLVGAMMGEADLLEGGDEFTLKQKLFHSTDGVGTSQVYSKGGLMRRQDPSGS